MNGPVGLRYEPLFHLLDRKGYQADEWWQAFDDIRVLERAALDCLSSNA